MPTAAEIAGFLEARVCPGDLGAVQVTHAAPIADADPGAISFVTATGLPAVELLANTRASVVIVHEAIPQGETVGAGTHAPVLVPCANRGLAFIRVLRRYFPPARHPSVHPSSVVDPAASLEDGIYIGPLATVGAQVKLGARTVIHAGVHIRPMLDRQRRHHPCGSGDRR
jgi:UDP-3-O-[3-hydroxymyristoyl] glucosamine N-acyltransferase